ncbi:MAG: hypothetical protein HQK83_11260 [Fibrobacteria bacterium]|nr:hypothetical protein [Fibrobacteria bacterium]
MVAFASATNEPLSLPSYLDYYSDFTNYPGVDTFNYKQHRFVTDYESDSLLSARTSLYLSRYHPEAAVYLICDLKSGHILSLGERRDNKNSSKPKMAFGNKFPAASLFKIITALTAVKKGTGPESKLLQIGSSHTLYKRQLTSANRASGSEVSLRHAFAHSYNPAFGLLGLELGADAIRESGENAGFNKTGRPRLVLSDLSVPDSGYALAEVACGFNQHTTVSPIHALELARALGHDGKLKNCSFSNDIRCIKPEAYPVHLSQPEENELVSKANLPAMQTLMEATTSMGTARKGFHKIMKHHHLKYVITGGKTGSVDGTSPDGRYDWFVGYAKLKSDPDRGIAIVIMQVHQTYQSLRSTYVAALLIKDWLRQQHKQGIVNTPRKSVS